MSNGLNKQECLFCRIGGSPGLANEVYRSDSIVAFLDNGPIREGHVQLIPIKHYNYFDDLPVDLVVELTIAAQRIARLQKRLFHVDRVAYLYTGGDIPHAHAHLVPMVEKTDITSRQYIKNELLTFAPIESPGDAVLAAVAVRIADELQALEN